MEHLDAIYVVRDAAFGRDFTPKLITALIAVGFVVWDVRRQRRLDYVWVFVFGTVILAAVEAVLSVQGIRDMPERVLFGQPLPLWASYLLQGASEGAFVAVVGLFLADRWLCRHTRRASVILGALVLLAIGVATVRSARRLPGFGDAASRRDVTDPAALVGLLVLALVGLVFYLGWRRWRPRAAAMFLTMVILAAGWTVAQTAVQGRWVEVPGSADGTFVEAGPALSALVLSFDVVVEIAAAYLPYLALPVMLRLMRDPTPMPHPPQVRPAA